MHHIYDPGVMMSMSRVMVVHPEKRNQASPAVNRLVFNKKFIGTPAA